MSKVVRGFVWGSRAWYHQAAQPRSDVQDTVLIGLYYREGGGEGEFAVEWRRVGSTVAPELRVHGESWGLLKQWPDFVGLLGQVNGRAITPQHFTDELKALGFVDLTPYLPPADELRRRRAAGGG